MKLSLLDLLKSACEALHKLALFLFDSLARKKQKSNLKTADKYEKSLDKVADRGTLEELFDL